MSWTWTAIALILALSQPIPQIRKLLVTGKMAGVSLTASAFGLVTNGAWMAYGLAREHALVVVMSTIYAIGWGIIAVILIRAGLRDGLFSALGLATGLAAMTALLGWTALATSLAFAVVVQFAPQVAEAWRSPDLSGLSPGLYLVCAIDAAVWGGYGIITSDVSIQIYGVVMALIVAAVLAPWVQWRVTQTGTKTPRAQTGVVSHS